MDEKVVIRISPVSKPFWHILQCPRFCILFWNVALKKFGGSVALRRLDFFDNIVVQPLCSSVDMSCISTSGVIVVVCLGHRCCGGVGVLCVVSFRSVGVSVLALLCGHVLSIVFGSLVLSFLASVMFVWELGVFPGVSVVLSNKFGDHVIFVIVLCVLLLQLRPGVVRCVSTWFQLPSLVRLSGLVSRLVRLL